MEACISGWAVTAWRLSMLGSPEVEWTEWTETHFRPLPLPSPAGSSPPRPLPRSVPTLSPVGLGAPNDGFLFLEWCLLSPGWDGPPNAEDGFLGAGLPRPP